LKQLETEAAPDIARRARLRARFPVHEMIRRGWIPASDDAAQIERDVLEFFGTRRVDETPRLWRKRLRTGYPRQVAGMELAWLFRVRQLTENLVSPPFARALLRRSFLARGSDDEISARIHEVPGELIRFGVRLVMVEEPAPESDLDAVCFWTAGRP